MHLFGVVAAMLAFGPQPHAASAVTEIVRPAGAPVGVHITPGGPIAAWRSTAATSGRSGPPCPPDACTHARPRFAS